MTSYLNPILRTDSYKTSHFLQYPAGTTRVSSYIEPRGGIYEEAVFFGLQAFIKQYLLTPITPDDVAEAEQLMAAHGVPFNRAGWDRIVEVWEGYLPLEIEAVAEGTIMPTQNVQVQVINTDPELPWLTSYIETALLRAIWYPSTIASLSRRMKQVIYAGLQKTSDDPDGQIGFKLHDFGARGATTSESAMLGGMAHLVNFMGTDTIEGLIGARRYYDAEMAGFSIPATEHSTITAWGPNGEAKAYENVLAQHPTGLVACVSDSYDIYHAVSEIWGTQLKSQVATRDGTLVVRPDSGDPVKMPLQVIEMLMEKFGHSVNTKGFRVLPDTVRVIQGDGMDRHSIPQLIDQAIAQGISVDNFAMGMGGGLLQRVERDTMNYAMKANAIEIDGNWRDVYKDPVTDPGKHSKNGRLALIAQDTALTTLRLDDLLAQGRGAENLLRPVYRNGDLLVSEDFEAVRKRAAI